MKEKIKKTVLVIGGTGGIGTEVCKKFASKNYNIIFTSKNIKKSKKFITKINNLYRHIKVSFYYLNVDDEQSIKKIVKLIINKKINLIINCIGYFSYDSAERIKYNSLVKFFSINTFPTILINEYLSKNIKSISKTKIFSIGSSSCYDGFKDTVLYSASKHALLGSIKSLNKKFFPKIHNISINPGSIKTKMGKKIKGQNYADFINAFEIADIIYQLNKIDISSTSFDDLYLKRIIK